MGAVGHYWEACRLRLQGFSVRGRRKEELLKESGPDFRSTAGEVAGEEKLAPVSMSRLNSNCLSGREGASCRAS
ncbi:hypothetical protein CDL15_Pgr018696 [Punica granatum]|uniref:Uncharacterized protein n=1 Tax=Punica granatum TaxID=22663 RepID=A0A218VUE7_PUNGR|nr:hypothetical protein CDL15_Pgr018694 [Punica granatum]OWM64125.1 hypothetical protein CDL15_Pgr018696 [Punica granatum]